MIDINGLPWHFKGVRDVKGCTTAREVIQAAKLDFNVNKCEIYANMPSTTEEIEREYDNNGLLLDNENKTLLYGGRAYRHVEGNYATYREDNNTPLGLVKSKYTIVQNRDAFKFFDDAIGRNEAIWDTAGCFDGGRRVFVSAKLPETITVGGKDKIENYLVFTNSHDGSGSVSIMLTPVRIICQNCLPGARRSAEKFIRFRHTESVHGNINQAAEILGIARQQEKIIETEFNKLAQIKMNDLQVMDYIAALHLSAEEYNTVKKIPGGMSLLYYRNNNVIQEANISTRKLNMLVNTFEYYTDGPGQMDIAGSAWGAFNAVTGYYSNIANLKDAKRMDSLLYGNAGNVMCKAFEAAAV